jgi:hypothetical protein
MCLALQFVYIFDDLTINTTDTSDINKKKSNKLRGLRRRSNYTDRATAACRLLRIEGATSAWRIPSAVISVFLIDYCILQLKIKAIPVAGIGDVKDPTLF